jgi:hypothetical protein
MMQNSQKRPFGPFWVAHIGFILYLKLSLKQPSFKNTLQGRN